MKALIFAQKKQTKEGKPFNTYLARLTKTNGEEKEVTRRKLWISKYSESSEKYVDHSLDEF